MIGIVKKWNGDRGFGFLETSSGDVFVHVKALGGLEGLEIGQSVQFELTTDPRSGKQRAKGVQLQAVILRETMN